jgi:hypothetical protein
VLDVEIELGVVGNVLLIDLVLQIRMLALPMVAKFAIRVPFFLIWPTWVCAR